MSQARGKTSMTRRFGALMLLSARDSPLMYHPHRRTGARVVTVVTREFTPSDIVDEVIRSAVRRRDFDHVQAAVDTKLFNGFGPAPLDRHLRFESGVRFESRRRRRRLRYRLKRRIARLARGLCFGRQRA